MVRIVICAKQVLDPDAVNNYAQWGRLKIDPEKKQIARDGIPLLMNAYDEQAIEAALRLRDDGADCHITVVTVGGDSCRDMMKHAFAMGADEGTILNDPAFEGADGLGIAYILAQAIKKLGGADLILCGRQASDDDQGVVGMALAERLGFPSVSIARDVRLIDDKHARVVRVLPDGEEVTEVELPALVTISNELGTPRYPTMKGMMEARRKQATMWTAADIEADPAYLETAGAHVRRADLFVPEVQGQCQFIEGANAEELATRLVEVLRQAQLI